MPHLVEMDKKYGKKGLRILAPEVQNSSVEAIEKLTEKHKIKYPILKGTTRPASLNGIPHAIVFDAKGDLVFEGHPMNEDFDKTIKNALRDVKVPEEEDNDVFSKPVIPERTWTNAEGKPLVASVTAIEGDSVKFKLKNGKQVNYPIAKLSEEDQEFIKNSAAKSEEDEE